MSSQLTPRPISSFNEVTDINNFNDDNLFTFLNVGGATPDQINSNLKFKNLIALIQNNIFPISDSEIETGINPENIDTQELASITSIAVNQYGRVVKLEGSQQSSTVPQAGIQTGSLAGTISIPSNGDANATFYSNASNFNCPYNGNILVTVYFTAQFTFTTGNNVNIPSISTVPIYVNNNSNVRTEITLKTSSNTVVTGRTGTNTITGTAVLLLPTTSGTTNWKIGVGYPDSTKPGYTFNYTVIFQNNAQ